MKDFASRALYELIGAELTRRGVALATVQQFGGKTERWAKADLLDTALTRIGASGVLAIGQGVRRVTTDATLAVLLKAISPADLLDRWQRLEGYYHGNNRVRTLALSACSMELEHYARSGRAPTAGEDLLIAGLLAALLQLIGARQVSLKIPDRVVLQNDQLLPEVDPLTETSRWCFRWSEHVPVSPTTVSEPQESIGEQLVSLVQTDLGRSWTVAAVAELLGLSVRSLQRCLAGRGTRFQTLLRLARAEGSAALLLTEELSLAEVGYAAGYADQAHFCREFKARFNLSPSTYLTIAGN